jgi:drug/metabolite transporter (DMT)-like permease
MVGNAGMKGKSRLGHDAPKVFMREKLMQYWWLILLSVFAGVAGQTVLKLGVSQPGAADATGNLISLVALIIRSPLVLMGLLLYAVGAVAWIAVLARLDLSLAYPFLALNFVLVTVASRLILGETVPALRWMGILVICSGILLVARSDT